MNDTARRRGGICFRREILYGAKSGNIGEKLTETVPTDIVTYVNGREVPSYNIDGRTVIYIDSLSVFGNISWDGGARTISEYV